MAQAKKPVRGAGGKSQKAVSPPPAVDADLVQRYIEQHGRWEEWTSYPRDAAGVRHPKLERKFVPCECAICQDAIAERGLTF